MKAVPLTKIAASLALLCVASPALANGFGLLLVYMVAPMVIVGAIVIAAVWIIRNAAKANGRNADAISAILLAVCFTPTTFFERYDNGGYAFEVIPAWVLVAFGEDWTILFPGPIIAILISSGLLYVMLVLRRDAPVERSDSEGS